MAITAADVQLLESERMRDTADGGGRMTGNVIPSGVANNVFQKVSRLDGVYGRVNLRKAYIAVRTANLDVYAGAHAIITDAPDSDKISCTLFSTDDAFDVRDDARNRIESYVVAGPLSRMRLYGGQLVGQKAISVYQRPEEPLPDVGGVFVLSIEGAGYTPAQQFVRVTDVEHEIRTFVELVGTQASFDRRVITLHIAAPLAQTFPGEEPTQFADPSPTFLRSTQVADAANYYGIAPLALPATSGDLSVKVANVYAPLVPSTQRETPITLAEISGALPSVASGAARSDTHNYTLNISPRTIVALGGILPGSLVVTSFGFTAGTDDGGGNFVPGSLVSVTGGTVDYATGRVTITGGYGAGVTTISHTPAPQANAPAHTRQIAVTLATRGSVYSETLNPLPAPGTTIVDFRSLGKWYRLRDNGAGQLVAGEPGIGTGSVSYVTGAVVVTLSALPDVDSAILLGWGSPVHYTLRSGASTDAATTLRARFQLLQTPVSPGSVSIAYPVNGVQRVATDPGSDGVLTGTGVAGKINYATGDVQLDFSAPPDVAGLYSATYSRKDGSGLVSNGSPTISGGQFTVPGTAPFVRSGTFQLVCNAPPALARPAITVTAEIASNGTVKTRAGQDDYVAWAADQVIGTFAESTGVVTLTADVLVTYNEWEPTNVLWNLQQTASYSVAAVFDLAVERDAATGTTALPAEDTAVSTAGLELDLTTTIGDPVVAGSLLMTVTGKKYIDRGGTLYADVDISTGSGTPAGSIDYQTGRCTLSYWANNVAVARSVQACLTQYGDWTAVEAFFRTAGSPLRPASFFVQVTAADGALLTATADVNGVVSGTDIEGTVDQTTGVVALTFGSDPGGGFVARQVMPATLRYNAVVLTDLPLDPEILGLDPVRLPSDGRVPIYRPGTVCVVHNTQTTALPDPAVASATYSVGRTDLAVLVVEDNNGTALPLDRYTVDLALGEVTMAADWNGTGVAEPLIARHRIEDMVLATDVQISGDIALSAQLAHDYPASTSYLSGALLFGDLQAIVSNVFDQQTWTSVWSNALIGSQANAQYDDVNHPIEVFNESAVTERWRVSFTSATAFQIVGENLGVIATGTTSVDAAPINPVTGDNYFVLRAAGWGSGWSTGNQLRFNTVGANAPIWLARTVLAGAPLTADSLDVEARGDVD